MKDKKNYLFEVSWEVCNKVGGIYTVIKSKLTEAKKEFGDDYCLIGPLFDNNPDFQEETGIEVTNLLHKLQGAGITAKVGRWKTDSAPRVVLVKYKDTLDQGKLLYSLWEDFGVESMNGGWDYLEPVLFSTVSAHVIEALSGLYSEHRILAQFHEWIAGAGLLYLKKKTPHIATIFTTHATVLGRSMCGNGVDIYSAFSQVNTDSEAARFGVTAKHSLESVTAREADCFTTVSEITALEARHILNVEADVVLPNGFDVKHVPDPLAQPDYFIGQRKKLVDFAAGFLKKELTPDNTLILSTSGRYEFHNKGIDLFLDSLGELRKQQGNLKKNVVAFLFVIAGGMQSPDSKHRSEPYGALSSHALWDPNNDPIIKACFRLNLQNQPADKVNVIFVPAFMNSRDGVLNMEYYDALAGCDLTVYPSYYEPWGYTPLESIAYSVPTISSDLAGFGKWVVTQKHESDGIKILRRLGIPMMDTTRAELTAHLLVMAHADTAAWGRMRQNVRNVALKAEWEIFFNHYLTAFKIAEKECQSRLAGRQKKAAVRFEGTSYRGTDSPRPRFKQFSVKTLLPKSLERLRDLSHNVWWAWNSDALELFVRLDPVLFEELGNNPVSLLETVDPKRLEAMAKNEAFLQLYENVMKKFDRYMGQQTSLIKDLEGITPGRPVAYFSMEYGFHECMPLYSGGLGILSGDHIKSSSDLNIPLVGIGLLYKNGYFKQGISKDGEQKVDYFHNDFFRMPLKEVSKNNERVTISVDFPGRMVYARVWEARVGRTPVYFLDTDIQENNPSDRDITAKLYGGDKRTRIEQEILLGIGGVRLLEELNLTPSVYHLNEGHSAFLILERFINLIRYNNLDHDTAREVIKASTVFTTHTPVPAGNEAFDLQLVENYLRHYVQSNRLSWQNFNDAGHKTPGETGPYEMTVLALKNTHRRNGVSKLHKLVSRKMWQDLWKGFLMEEIPIDHVTNGVHVGTWLTSEMQNLILKYSTLNLDEDLLKIWEWDKLAKIPDDILWQTHIALKNKLYNTVKERVTANWTREGEDPALVDKFLMKYSPNPLTIGFARRFATYKRATLFLRDTDRLRNILNNKKYPVQFIFAGKAHPADRVAFDLIKQIVTLSKRDEFIGKIIFVENYDMTLSRRLISGADVWLNNPLRPLEASGTSGQKAGINGVINFSVLDGWWDEAYDGSNGWAIGDRKEYKNSDTQDLIDSDSLYDTLEGEIIPNYYQRNSAGVPEKWLKTMKRCIISVISEFNTHRMLKDYVKKLYVPTAKHSFAMTADNFKKAHELAEWKKSVTARFSSIHINNVTLDGIQGDNLNISDEIKVDMEVNAGRATPEEIKAQLIVVQDRKESSIDFTEVRAFYDEKIITIPMTLAEEKGAILRYHGTYKADKAGKFNYGVRILPCHPDVEDMTDLNLVYWA
ncbi:MAG: alpha-glucan family phosphorylase [Fibrobacterota bacterium]